MSATALPHDRRITAARSPLSVRAVLAAAAAAAVLLIWLMAALATLSVQRASAHLGDARNSYEQLAIINRLEAQFGRLLLSEMEAIASSDSARELGRPSIDAIDPLFRRLDVSRPVEIADLARQCNAMAARLAEQQERLTRANEALEDTVRERTRQLEESGERLRAIDASRRLFFGKISHELRTPVTVLIGEAEVALRSREDAADSYRTALEHILATVGYLRRRLGDLIGLPRSEDGRVQIERQPLSLRDCLRDAVTVAEAYARSSSVVLEAEAGSAVAAILGDASWIRQATLALIDNAVKFSPPDGRVTARVVSDREHHVIEIADQGPGISTDLLPAIFDPYQQTADGRERGGAGLGLAVARWVAEQHGGGISARNAADGGLVVRMAFPAGSIR